MQGAQQVSDQQGLSTVLPQSVQQGAGQGALLPQGMQKVSGQQDLSAVLPQGVQQGAGRVWSEALTQGDQQIEHLRWSRCWEKELTLSVQLVAVQEKGTCLDAQMPKLPGHR